MPSKNDPTSLGTANPQGSTPDAWQGTETRQLLEALNRLVSTMQSQNELLGSTVSRADTMAAFGETEPPFEFPEGTAARSAAERFNQIVAGLRVIFPPNKPKNVVLIPSQNAVTLKWEFDPVPSGAEGFKILRCSGTNCTPEVVIARPLPHEREYQDSNLTAGTLYRYRVVPYNAAGDAQGVNIDETTTTA